MDQQATQDSESELLAQAIIDAYKYDLPTIKEALRVLQS
jgi:hypothetical protein